MSFVMSENDFLNTIFVSIYLRWMWTLYAFEVFSIYYDLWLCSDKDEF